MIRESSRRLACRWTLEYSRFISAGAMQSHPTLRFYRTFTKIRLTLRPLTSRLCWPTTRSAREGIITNSTIMDTKESSALDQLSVEALAAKLESDLLPT